MIDFLLCGVYMASLMCFGCFFCVLLVLLFALLVFTWFLFVNCYSCWFACGLEVCFEMRWWFIDLLGIASLFDSFECGIMFGCIDWFFGLVFVACCVLLLLLSLLIGVAGLLLVGLFCGVWVWCFVVLMFCCLLRFLLVLFCLCDGMLLCGCFGGFLIVWMVGIRFCLDLFDYFDRC